MYHSRIDVKNQMSPADVIVVPLTMLTEVEIQADCCTLHVYAIIVWAQTEIAYMLQVFVFIHFIFDTIFFKTQMVCKM